VTRVVMAMTMASSPSLYP